MTSKCVYDTITCLSARNVVYDGLREFTKINKVGGGKLFEISPGICAISPDVENFRLFMHPAELPDSIVTYIDPRPYVKADGQVRAPREYKTLLLRAALDHEYNVDKQGMEHISAPVAAIFAQWMVNTLNMHYALEQVDKERVRVVMGIYYYLLFTPNIAKSINAMEEVDSRVERFVLGALRQSRQFYEDIRNSFDDYKLIQNCRTLADAVTTMVRLVDSPAFRPTYQSLITTAINGWTQREVELCGSSLEHIPSLIYMIVTSLEISAFNKTKVGQAVQSAQRMKVDPSGIVRWAREVAEMHSVAANSTKNFNVQ